ncbi:SIP domain-containing protein, partial [Streptomyces sp. NPDC052644]
AFVHGEATFVKELRRLLRVERSVPREALSISGYWRQGMDDEGWRSTKPDWNRQVEAEEAAAVG